MFKTSVIAASLAVSLLGVGSVFAAGEATSTINISANIPTKQFHAQPRDPSFGVAETMDYNTITGNLNTLRAVYDVKNTDGHIAAYIEGGPASLSNGSSAIALTTTFNGVTLDGTSKQVVDDASSTPGTQADMVITPAKPADTQNGLFTTSMVVVFDSVPRVPPAP
ncbi:adhesin [Pseudomonas yamanorum]|uniref:Adhesin n=1 Tax=Pseudomonas yamanorum TaxID=515393 RepID=A0A7Y8EMF9_9PSED|nr:CS1 type fimbrial major subunit [Pseudomonas yamanorum]NVZ83756.1 adhesin [Pseudomonas yamanorum]NWE17380.1 adhesin [Pseudomonas yamanorum]NWE37864.1 adhesin [Pseudomonas yamanorum]